MSEKSISVICAACGVEHQITLVESELGELYINVQGKIWIRFRAPYVFAICKNCIGMEEIQIKD